MSKDNFVVLDLEMNQPSNKIISVGAYIVDVKTKMIHSRFERYIKIDEQLNPYITQLTGITQEMVDNGVNIKDAAWELKELMTKYDCFINPVTWGGGDSELLTKQSETFLFGRRWIDVKTLHVSLMISKGQHVQGGLSKVLTRYGMKFKGKKHNAADDAYNTARLFLHLLNHFQYPIVLGVEDA